MKLKIKNILLNGLLYFGIPSIFIWLYDFIMKVDVGLFNILNVFASNMIMTIVGLAVVIVGSALTIDFIKSKID